MVPPGGNQYTLCEGLRLTYVLFTSGRNVYAQSNWPLLTSSWLVACELASAGKTTRDGAIFAASQYLGFLDSVYWVGANEESMKGPVPTGLVLAYFAGSEIVDQMCSGTIGVCAIVAANGTFADLNVNVTC